MRKSTIFFIWCLLFIAGVAVHSVLAPERRLGEPFWWYILFLMAVACGIVSFGFSPLKLFGIWCLGFGIFSLSLFRYAQTIARIDAYHILSALEKPVALQGVVNALPRVQEKTVSYVVRLENRKGSILLTTDSIPTYGYGDRLAFTCTPTLLSMYEQYVVREGVSASCTFPEHVTRIAENQGSRVLLRLLAVRRTFEAHLQRLFADPYGGLLSGILYGDTAGLSRELKAAFRTTGLAHITALSGYNITIISFMLMSLLISVGFFRLQALPLAILLILGFVLVTGAEASVVRATLMGFLVLAAKGIGRLSKPKGALALAGAVMLAVNPRLLRFDLGFLLSFLATIALVWFADDLAKRTLIRHLPRVWGIREAGAASLAALLFTTPAVLWKTGILGPFSLLVNILVVPVVPAAMALGFVAVLLDLLWHPLGLAVAFVARVPLAYIISVAEWFAKFGAWQFKISFMTAFLLFIGIVYGVQLWKTKAQIA